MHMKLQFPFCLQKGIKLTGKKVHIDSALTLKSFGPFITPIRANVSKEHKREALSASASSAHTPPYRQNAMAQAVWNRYCGQQHRYWIDQESWCSIQHICNCNLPLPEAIPSNHFKTIFFSLSLSIFKETQSLSRWLSAPRCCPHPNVWPPTHSLKVQQLSPISPLDE